MGFPWQYGLKAQCQSHHLKIHTRVREARSKPPRALLPASAGPSCP